MIIGIGTDIVQVNRIEKVIKRTKCFIDKAFTDKEIEYIRKKNNNSQTIAGYFAAKEAMAKALGTGFRGVGLRDIEIINDSLGKPSIRISDKIEKILQCQNYNIFLSISHTNENAIAFVVLEGIGYGDIVSK